MIDYKTIQEDFPILSVIQWKLSDNGIGKPLHIAGQGSASVQISGRLSGAIVSIKGTNDQNDWATLTTKGGDKIITSVLGDEQTRIYDIQEKVFSIQPVVIGGESADITITILVRR